MAGLIRRSPEEKREIIHLVERSELSVKATLEELEEADLLVHVVDLSNDDFRYHIEVVDNLLAELGLAAIPCLKVYNKLDLLDRAEVDHLITGNDSVAISALDPETFAPFLEKAQQMMQKAIRNEYQGWR